MRLTRVVTTGTAVLALGACNNGPQATAPAASPISMAIVSGNGQSAPVSTQLPQPLRVRVVNASGQPVPNFTVDFVVTSGGGSVFGGAEVTDASGYVDELWTLGPRLGSQTLAARSVNPTTGASVTYGTFTATATPPANVVVVGSNATGIFIMNANGSGFKQITTSSADYAPSLSPDHRKVAFLSTLGSGQAVYLVNVGSTTRHVISSGFCSPSTDGPHFSPDGNLIVYTGVFVNPTCVDGSDGGGLQIVDTLGNIIQAWLQEATVVYGSSWSADGQHYFFSSNELSDGANLYESFPVPSAPDNFTRDSWETAVELTHSMDVALSAPSPDGQHIAFFGDPFPGGYTPGFVYIMNSDGSNPRPITNALGVGSVLSYSPDGTLIAIDHGFMNADGTGYTVVKGCPCQFAWK